MERESDQAADRHAHLNYAQYNAEAELFTGDAFPWGGLATGRCGGHAQVSRQAKHYAHRGIIALVSCDKAFQDPCHSETREQKYVQQHIRICTHGVKTGLG